MRNCRLLQAVATVNLRLGRQRAPTRPRPIVRASELQGGKQSLGCEETPRPRSTCSAVFQGRGTAEGDTPRRVSSSTCRVSHLASCTHYRLGCFFFPRGALCTMASACPPPPPFSATPPLCGCDFLFLSRCFSMCFCVFDFVFFFCFFFR